MSEEKEIRELLGAFVLIGAEFLKQLNQLNQQGVKIMANLQDLLNAQTQTIQSVNDFVTKVQSYQSDVQNAFNHLEQIIAAGAPVPQTALDALNSLGTAISTQSSALDTAIATAQTEATK